MGQAICPSVLTFGTAKAHHITLHYSDIVFKEKNFNHFTRVKRNRKDELSVDVRKQVVMWQI